MPFGTLGAPFVTSCSSQHESQAHRRSRRAAPVQARSLGCSLCFSPVGGLPGAQPVVQPMQGLVPAWADGAHRAQGYARGAEGNRGQRC
jgi:hypothetical protein